MYKTPKATGLLVSVQILFLPCVGVLPLVTLHLFHYFHSLGFCYLVFFYLNLRFVLSCLMILLFHVSTSILYHGALLSVPKPIYMLTY